MLAFFVILCFLGIGYAYFGYPLVLALLTRGVKAGTPPPDSAPTVPLTVIVAARNEATVIRLKLEETLALEYDGQVQVIVASDASDDGTDEIVGEFPDYVELARLPERGGKEKAQALALTKARGEIVVFSDAKVRLERTALKRFAAYFSDPLIGAVSSIDRVEGAVGSGEGFYVRYEMWLRRLESKFNSLIGLSGSCFAVRRIVAEKLRTDIPSDFALLIAARKLGYRGVLAEDVVCTYKAVSTEEEEFHRKVRTVLRGITALFACLEVLNPSRYGLFAWQMFSHKLGRWLVPWLLIFGTLGALILAGSSSFFALIAALLALFYALALVGLIEPKLRPLLPVKIPLFFLTSNAGILMAWLHYMSGKRSIAWNPSVRR